MIGSVFESARHSSSWLRSQYLNVLQDLKIKLVQTAQSGYNEVSYRYSLNALSVPACI